MLASHIWICGFAKFLKYGLLTFDKQSPNYNVKLIQKKTPSVLPPQVSYHTEFPNTPSVLPHRVPFHPECPTTPSALPPQVSYHPKCPTTPSVLPPRVSYHPECPTTPSVLPPRVSYHPECPTTPSVLPPHTAGYPPSRSQSTSSSLQEKGTSAASWFPPCPLHLRWSDV
ncbi:hypothetical protein JTE90_002862 [Oedothorax gibbosus]|uniref:Uncharacterized protein n=1 Tax=Oedothorax gibbosus TaxID=931172 RepID=A0AAV6TVB8_9ARAC|nr:hypothetical protein JTE90_002862 [Oedothorax gibbosus]